MKIYSFENTCREWKIVCGKSVSPALTEKKCGKIHGTVKLSEQKIAHTFVHDGNDDLIARCRAIGLQTGKLAYTRGSQTFTPCAPPSRFCFNLRPHPRSDRPNGTLDYVLPLLCLERSTTRKKVCFKVL
jgi:hypothetical protein